MEVYIATLETSDYLLDHIKEGQVRYALTSYYYLKNQSLFDRIISKVSDKMLIDSGAHSFQHGKKVDFESYTIEYANFIKRNSSNPKIEGFFEMDVDNVIGYDQVLRLRRILNSASDKIIPVWHNNRGVEEFKKMCDERRGKKVAITGFANNDISDGQYNLFINEAHRRGCSIHVLGCTRYGLIQTLNLGKEDSVDSSSWKQGAIFGDVDLPTRKGGNFKLTAFEGMKTNYKKFMMANYLTARAIQEHYYPIDNSIPSDKLISE
jgi:hypothetical protein